MSEKISVIIPVYNECKTIKSVLDGLSEALASYEHEIIVVNDGSTDETEKALNELTGLKVFNHSERRGYGAAIKTGMRAAQGQNILIIDADGTYPTEFTPKLIEALDDSEMAVAARGNQGHKTGEGFLRATVKGVLTRLANYIVERQIPDLNSGMRAFRLKEAMQFYRLLPNGFSFTTTITLAMLSDGMEVEYIDIPYEGRRSKSKFRPVADTMNMLILILRAAVYFNPMRVFLPMSVGLIALGFVVLAISVIFEGKAWDITIISIFVAAVQVFALGLIADLIIKRSK